MAGKLQVDSDGFRKRVAWRGPFGALSELISNALDERITRCDVTFEHVSQQTYVIRVEDDSPDGFRNLEESYTLYADSYKANTPSLRGRFNVGEKVAIILCDEARIESTTGTVIFKKNDVSRSPKRRDRGTTFEGTIRCTREQFEDACRQVKTIIPPENICLTFNGEPLRRPMKLASVEASLPTIATNPEGELIRTVRTTTIDVYERREGEASGAVYELGIPVVDVEHPHLLDVRQKVPLSVDRNSVTPGYYRKLCGAVLDGTYDKLTEEQARSKGITEGIAGATKNEAVQAVMAKLHGEQRFVPDPTNREATGELTARGYVSVPPNAYDRETWSRIREAKAVPSGSELMPKRSVPPIPLPEKDMNEGMKHVAALSQFICKQVLGKKLRVLFSNNRNVTCSAQCGPVHGDPTAVELVFHVPILGEEWFSVTPAICQKNLDLIFHELGHHKGDEDCTREFADQVTFVASSVSVTMLTHPELFEKYR